MSPGVPVLAAMPAGAWVVAAVVGLAVWGASGAVAGTRLRALARSARDDSSPRPAGRPEVDAPARPVRRAVGRAKWWPVRSRPAWAVRWRARWQGGRGGPGATDLPALVGELAQLTGAGMLPASAWRYGASAARDDPVGAAVRAAAEAAGSGRSVADELDRAVQHLDGPSRTDLIGLAGAWRVVEVTGAPAAQVLDRVAAGLRDAADVRDARTTAMAAPLATARLLAALPLIGLFLGQLMGASPLQVLLGTNPGRVSAVVGLAFAAVGAVWTRRLLRSASAPG